MKEDNVILQKTYAFAVRIVRLSQYLIKEKHAFQLADQIRRSGTSIGANYGRGRWGIITQGFCYESRHCLQRGTGDTLLAQAFA